MNYSYQWHYQNLKDSLTTNDLSALFQNPKSEGDHLFYALQMMIERLKKDHSDAEALKFLVHFAGDLHQPMHLGSSSGFGRKQGRNELVWQKNKRTRGVGWANNRQQKYVVH